ncbi:Bax inhibitor 1-related like protein [Aduncisulcus paluster]|uniref:Bax inhibitor 1-related like protein n=1 Tax=Aduncisulcus paluster TaxID=2918883 RepID=A0ABQ5KT70_9EUKA|nr:Bax inhibitor 1-related like protein [Aduncisulcus paluster]|eukprot:gnl/Carplike_NY0171/1226_a1653_1570.p1 GENE.gnl/Carplike_NY0171/1226_a1653_1570~~gnl/Carplike_NY0171/1226_a1653_1570.p1  ORF type:complete len:238 (+),score=32.12 gnl/Carplike_NY0171/1226_a1653_1570:21-734(+)
MYGVAINLPPVMNPPDELGVKDDAQIEAAANAMMQMAFFRKVYGLLTFCLGITVLVCALFRGATDYVYNNAWLIITAFIGTFVFLITLFCVHKNYPVNLLFLFLFVGCVSVLLGCLTAFFEISEIFAAAAITLSLTVGMTVIAFLASFEVILMYIVILFVLIYAAYVPIMWFWWAFSGAEIGYSCLGSLVMCLYIIVDTFVMKEELSVDECIIAVSKLFIDIIYLFIFILSVIGGGS